MNYNKHKILKKKYRLTDRQMQKIADLKRWLPIEPSVLCKKIKSLLSKVWIANRKIKQKLNISSFVGSLYMGIVNCILFMHVFPVGNNDCLSTNCTIVWMW